VSSFTNIVSSNDKVIVFIDSISLMFKPGS